MGNAIYLVSGHLSHINQAMFYVCAVDYHSTCQSLGPFTNELLFIRMITRMQFGVVYRHYHLASRHGDSGKYPVIRYTMNVQYVRVMLPDQSSNSRN